MKIDPVEKNRQVNEEILRVIKRVETCFQKENVDLKFVSCKNNFLSCFFFIHFNVENRSTKTIIMGQILETFR